MRYSCLLAAFLFLALTVCNLSVVAQEERITQLDVAISLHEDRSIEVTETIRVIAAGDQIKRGIFRSLPTKRLGNRFRYSNFKIRKNGSKEPYHTVRSGSDLKLYIGKEDIFLDPGPYTYEISYRVANQITLYPSFDEVFWNAVGTQWDFPVESSSCIITLPDGVSPIQSACYTGKYGLGDSNCTITAGPAPNQLIFQLSQPLRPREGFSVAVGFPKGVVAPPSFLERFGTSILLAIGSVGLLAYYLLTFFRYGIDPPKPASYPLYEAPEQLSPAALAYIYKEKYDPECLTASIIHLATKGYLRIEEQTDSLIFIKKTSYTLIREKSDYKNLSPEETAVMYGLFTGTESITIGGKYNAAIKSASDLHRQSLKREHGLLVQQGNNRLFLIIPVLTTLLLAVLSIILLNRSNSNTEGAEALTLFLFFATIPIFGFVAALRSKSVPKLLKGCMLPLIFMFVAAAGVSLNALSIQPYLKFLEGHANTDINLVALGLFVPFSIIAILLYGYLIKQPSVAKQKLRSEIEGFRMYLNMTEKERLELLNPPSKTPEHFEAMLPFAFATGVAHRWSETFKGVLEAASYEPRWSNNPHFYNHHGFASDFGRSMVQSSTPSSSGSGGGGFSGGGGGGGGGGGW